MALTPEEEAKFRLMMASYDSGKTIPQMPVATGLDGTELVEVIQNSASSKSTINDIISLVDSYYVGASATKIVKDATNSTIAKSDFLGNQIDLTYARKDELSGWSIGDIKLHFGSLAGIGADWHVCDGGTYNGVKTPDMGGAYPIGYKESSAATPTTVTDKSENYGAIGNICGSNAYKLKSSESGVPAHDHPITTDLGSSYVRHASTDLGPHGDSVQVKTLANTPQDAAETHENRPNSVVLAFLMKIA